MHQKGHRARQAAWAALAPAVTLLLAGCGGDKPHASASHASTSAKVATSAPASPPPTAASGPALPKAADGTRLSACADARCEVKVKVGDDIHFNASGTRKAGLDDVKMKSIEKNKVVYDLAGGSTSFTQPGPNRTANVNGISLTLERADGEHAVIRIGGPKRGALTVRVGAGGGGMVVTTPSG